MTDFDLVVYHGNCPDGWCAAYVASLRYPKAELLPRNYGTSAPFAEVVGRNVLMVDISWPRADMERMHASAASFVCLDHHKTAQAALAGLPYVTFDMEESGATLTWDHMFPGVVRPWYVSYTRDRDLWRFELPQSKEVNAYLMALPQDRLSWETLDQHNEWYGANLGRAILMHVGEYVKRACEQAKFGELYGHSVAVVNAQYMNISEVCHALLDATHRRIKPPIALGWFEREDGKIQFSLRGQSIDVSEIAKKFGGGGHPAAAGFELSIVDGRNLIDGILGRTA